MCNIGNNNASDNFIAQSNIVHVMYKEMKNSMKELNVLVFIVSVT